MDYNELFNDLYDDLTMRSKNLIERLGGLENAYNYFIIHNNFYEHKNIGVKTNNELVDFF